MNKRALCLRRCSNNILCHPVAKDLQLRLSCLYQRSILANGEVGLRKQKCAKDFSLGDLFVNGCEKNKKNASV